MKSFIKNHFKPVHLLLLLPILVAVCWWDTKAYLDAVRNFEKTPKPILVKNMNDVSADVGIYSRCMSLAVIHPETYERVMGEAVRACLLKELPAIKTSTGAMIASTTAWLWLREHPSDKAVQDAAIIAIINGRNDVLSSLDWYYSKMDAIYEGHDRSILLTMLDGRYTQTSLEYVIDKLERAEYSVMEPTKYREQSDWRLSVGKSLASINQAREEKDL